MRPRIFFWSFLKLTLRAQGAVGLSSRGNLHRSCRRSSLINTVDRGNDLLSTTDSYVSLKTYSYTAHLKCSGREVPSYNLKNPPRWPAVKLFYKNQKPCHVVLNYARRRLVHVPECRCKKSHTTPKRSTKALFCMHNQGQTWMLGDGPCKLGIYWVQLHLHCQHQHFFARLPATGAQNLFSLTSAFEDLYSFPGST